MVNLDSLQAEVLLCFLLSLKHSVQSVQSSAIAVPLHVSFVSFFPPFSLIFIRTFYIMNHSTSEHNSFSVMQYLLRIHIIFTRQVSSISQPWAGVRGILLKGHNLKALHFFLLAFTRPMMTIGLHPVPDLPEGES